MSEPYLLTLTEAELRLLWMGTEVLREANPDDPAAVELDRKVTLLISEAGI